MSQKRPCQKRPIGVKRDVYMSEETKTCQQRPIYVAKI